MLVVMEQVMDLLLLQSLEQDYLAIIGHQIILHLTFLVFLMGEVIMEVITMFLIIKKVGQMQEQFHYQMEVT